jgi:hypothetical protein
MRMVKAIAMILVAVLAAGGAYWFWPETSLPSGVTAERLQIDKGARRLVIFADGRAVKSYRISLGRVPEGAKDREGDGRTPEGATSSITARPTATITGRCTSPIQVPTTAAARENLAFRPAARS